MVHTGHKSIDKGLLGKRGSKRVRHNFVERARNIKRYKLAICRLTKMTNGNFARGTNNNEIH